MLNRIPRLAPAYQFALSDDIGKFVPLVAQSLLVLIASWLLNGLMFASAALPESSYFQPVLVWELLKNPALLIVLLAANGVLAWRWKDLQWAQFEQGSATRIAIFTAVMTLAWAFSTYDFNLYFNQPHWVDRILLIGLAAGVFFHPAFVPSFTVMAIMMASQFNNPVASFGWADKQLIFDILILFSVWLVGALLIGWRNMQAVLFLIICAVLTNYLYAGMRKLSIGWISHEYLMNLIASSYINGWLAFIDQTTFLQALSMLAPFNPLFIFMTLLIELGVVVFFAHRYAPWPILIGCAILHLMIFITSGIFFWKWMAVDISLLIALRMMPPEAYQRFFNGRFLATSILVFFAAYWLLHPTSLGWFDTPLTVAYKFEAVGESGEVYEIHNDFMAPYDLIFSQNRFYYLSDQSVIVGTYGQVKDADQLIRINSVNSANLAASVSDLNNQIGAKRTDRSLAKRFDQFIQTYFRNLNGTSSKTIFINAIRAPYHISNFPSGEPYRMQEKVKQFLVWEVTAYYDGNNIHYLSKNLIRTIEIEP